MSKQTNGKKISLEQARDYVKNYSDETSPAKVRTISMLIGKTYIENLIRQDGCEYVRFYMAKTAPGEDGQYTFVVIGADAQQKDIIAKDDAEIYQELGLCPPVCNGGGTL